MASQSNDDVGKTADKLVDTLQELGLIDRQDIDTVYYPRVRDDDTITVHRARKSGVIFLMHGRNTEQVDAYYEQKDGLEYWGTSDYEAALERCALDDERRARNFHRSLKHKNWVDVGSGVVRLESHSTNKTCAVEPQPAPRALIEKYVCAKNSNVTTAKSVGELEDGVYDVATLFHVLEHLSDPIGALSELRTKMSAGAKLIVEVPHARDSLIVDHECEAFKAWTFWSEHLVLHTRDSLRIFLEKAGFSDIKIEGCQRYGLANHLRWLSEGEKGGHESRAEWSNSILDRVYEIHLKEMDRTDTLIATATVGANKL